MIPRIIHQTWKTSRVPERFVAFGESWAKFNPGWRRILWTDRMLLEFVEANYPDLLAVYCGYSSGVARADAARYMLLHKLGGLYADIDAECTAPLDPLAQEERVVLCHEPPAHWPAHTRPRGHPYTLFNGVMAGPPGHPFWRALIDRLRETQHASNVLDATGPFLLTGAYLGFEPKESVRIEGCHLFTPIEDTGGESPRYGMPECETLTRHHWAGIWFEKSSPRRRRFRRSIVKRYHQLRVRLTRGRVLDPAEVRSSVDPSVLARPAPAGDNIAILVPVRDALGHIDSFVTAIGKLDLPPKTVKLVFCEGDSVDGTAERLEEIAVDLRRRYRDAIVLRQNVNTRIVREQRWDRNIQRMRRAGIAKVRNHLIDHGLDETDDWALWIDIDVWRFPPDVVQKLRATGARIVAPHCTTVPGGHTFDLNSFVWVGGVPEYRYYRFIKGGIFQPPPRHFGRLYLEDFRHTERVELHGVGGTMLLVDASLHRGGLRFPEIPYKHLIETEAFGVLARDLGVPPVGLPRVEIQHVPY